MTFRAPEQEREGWMDTKRFPNRFFVGFAGARAMVASWDAACSVLCLWILFELISCGGDPC